MDEHFVGRIEDLMGQCVDAAVKAGWDGLGREPYAFTREDLDWIVAELGRKPSADEWEEAGMGWVGGDHVAEGA